MTSSLPKQKVAILGNGQLADMMHEEANLLGLQTVSFPLPKIDVDGSCTQDEIQHWLKKLKSFNFITYEIENIPVTLLKELAKEIPVYPAISALAIAQDRYLEKTLFKQLNIRTNNYRDLQSFAELENFGNKYKYPFIIKTRRFGYDGKGQYVLKSPKDLPLAWQVLGIQALIAESFVDFDYEVSQIAVRDKNGNIIYYPLVRNEHRDGILRETHIIKNNLIELNIEARLASKKILEHFDYIGVLAIEFFVKENKLFANEMAPRVHNSGHWSVDGANVSQFENHLRAISGIKLKDVKMMSDYIKMINLIGEDVSNDCFSALDNVFVKSYGKDLRENRKMGHINIVATDKLEFENLTEAVYKKISAMRCL